MVLRTSFSSSAVLTLVDSNGITHIASFFDPNLVNPWGLTSSLTGAFWVADAGAGVSTLYNTVGAPQPLVVSIPASQFNNDPFERGGIPTGAVFNIAPTLADQPGGFKISGNETFGNHAPTTASAVFLFATKQGAIVGCNPGVDPAADGFDPAQSGKFGIILPKASSIGTAALCAGDCHRRQSHPASVRREFQGRYGGRVRRRL